MRKKALKKTMFIFIEAQLMLQLGRNKPFCCNYNGNLSIKQNWKKIVAFLEVKVNKAKKDVRESQCINTVTESNLL